MFDFRRIFARGSGPSDPDSDYHPSDRKGVGLETEYQTLIANQFRRWGIAPTAVTIEVKKIGAHEGFDVFVGMVRLERWERTSALRVLLGMPLLETKIRKTVRASWLADFSHFGGLWLHASEQMEVPGELRDLLATLVPGSGREAGVPDSRPETAGFAPLQSASSLSPSAPGSVNAPFVE